MSPQSRWYEGNAYALPGQAARRERSESGRTPREAPVQAGASAARGAGGDVASRGPKPHRERPHGRPPAGEGVG